jgi:hypothetical protein
MGIERPQVKRLAALEAGYGKSSLTEDKMYQAVDKCANRNLKRPHVIEYIRSLGLEKDGKYWREISNSDTDLGLSYTKKLNYNNLKNEEIMTLFLTNRIIRLQCGKLATYVAGFDSSYPEPLKQAQV